MKTTNVHPAVTALETAMASFSEARQRIGNYARWANQVADEIDPTRWTKRIEEALGKQEELERLRVTYDEKAISAMSTWIRQGADYRHYTEARSLLLEALRAVLVAYDAIPEKSKDQWLKQIMQTRCVEAVELHRGRDTEDMQRVDDRSSLYNRAYNCMVEAFTILHTRTAGLTGPCRAYPTDLVVSGRKYDSFLHRSVDLRHVSAVKFSDCVNFKHPASQKLSDLIEQLEPLIAAARLAEARLKGGQNPYDENCSKINNGTINERQHANRLMDALHGEPYGCAPSAKHVEDQNERRRLYEGVRQEVLIAHKQLQAHYEELCETLYAAVMEMNLMLTEVKADRCTTIDRWETLRIGLNNCLAVDSQLRGLGLYLSELLSLYSRDLSQGAGLRTIEEKFADAERTYRPWQPKTESTAAAQ